VNEGDSGLSVEFIPWNLRYPLSMVNKKLKYLLVSRSC